ncbi:MAG: isoprenylcysteine carboxylmethyltransferase family protein [Roseiflexaceae bacterium]
MSTVLYTLLLAAVGMGRLVEMRISRRRQRALAARGAEKVAEPHFRWMVLLHGGVLAGAALEVWLLARPFIPALAIPMILLFALSNALRWWVIRTLAGHWNVQVMDSIALGVVAHGPYRWVRHPNYLAVFAELLALPLIHSAWLTALLGGLAHIWVLRQRITVEEEVLLADPAYRAAMGHKARFIPRVKRDA